MYEISFVDNKLSIQFWEDETRSILFGSEFTGFPLFFNNFL